MERWPEANWVYLQGEMERVTAAMERVMARQPTTLDPPTMSPGVRVNVREPPV